MEYGNTLRFFFFKLWNIIPGNICIQTEGNIIHWPLANFLFFPKNRNSRKSGQSIERLATVKRKLPCRYGVRVRSCASVHSHKRNPAANCVRHARCVETRERQNAANLEMSIRNMREEEEKKKKKKKRKNNVQIHRKWASIGGCVFDVWIGTRVSEMGRCTWCVYAHL